MVGLWFKLGKIIGVDCMCVNVICYECYGWLKVNSCWFLFYGLVLFFIGISMVVI